MNFSTNQVMQLFVIGKEETRCNARLGKLLNHRRQNRTDPFAQSKHAYKGEGPVTPFAGNRECTATVFFNIFAILSQSCAIFGSNRAHTRTVSIKETVAHQGSAIVKEVSCCSLLQTCRNTLPNGVVGICIAFNALQTHFESACIKLAKGYQF